MIPQLAQILLCICTKHSTFSTQASRTVFSATREQLWRLQGRAWHFIPDLNPVSPGLASPGSFRIHGYISWTILWVFVHKITSILYEP